jgi:hypothetical protein
MRSEMATLRSAQGQQELLKKQYESIMNPQGASGAAGAPAGMGTIPGLTPAQTNAILSSPSVQTELGALAPNDYLGRLAVIKKASQTEFGSESKSRYGAAENTPQPTFIPELKTNLDLTTNEFREYQNTRKLPSRYSEYQDQIKTTGPSTTAISAGVPSVATGNQPKYLNTSAAQTANKLGNTAGEFTDDELNRLASTESGKDPFALNKDTKAMGRYQFMPETVQSLHQRGISFNPFDEKQSREVARSELNRLTKELGSKELALAAYGGFRDKDPTKYISGILTTAPTATNKTIAPAQNVSLPSQRAELTIAKTAPAGNADLPYPVPRNAAEVNANQKFIEERGKKSLEIASKGPEKASTEAGTRQAQMFKLNEDADDAIKAADQVIAASKNFPETVGLGKGFTGANIATTAISALPKMDQNKAEDRYASFILTKPGQQAARDQVDTASKQLGISFAADVFKGARLGIGLENMAAGAKGVSVHNLAENNLINATIIKEAALFNKARTQLFKNWAESNGGKMADFEKFETSPQYIELKEQTQKRIVDSLPNYLKLTKDGLEEVNPTKKSSSENLARAEQERRRKSKENQ